MLESYSRTQCLRKKLCWETAIKQKKKKSFWVKYQVVFLSIKRFLHAISIFTMCYFNWCYDCIMVWYDLFGSPKKERGIIGTKHSGAPVHNSLKGLSNILNIKLILCSSWSQARHTCIAGKQPEGPGNDCPTSTGADCFKATWKAEHKPLSDLASTSQLQSTEILRGSSVGIHQLAEQSHGTFQKTKPSEGRRAQGTFRLIPHPPQLLPYPPFLPASPHPVHWPAARSVRS